MNRDWKFYKGTVENGHLPALDDRTWETVQLGHTWNNLDGQDGTPGCANINDTNYFRGDGWYRKHVRFESADKNKLFYLRFQGANTQAEVFVNGTRAGFHAGGYTAFCVDITPFVCFDADTLIAVRVNNARCDEIAPLTADFTFYGGIYREIELIKKDPVHFNFGKLAARGLKIITPDVTPEQATCILEAEVHNASSQPVEITVNAVISAPKNFTQNPFVQNTDFAPDAMLAPCATQTDEKRLTLAPDACEKVSFTFSVSNPHLWNGRQNPYLYEAALTLICDGDACDSLQDTFGFRFFSVDKNNGFFLNGKSYPLRGVSRHQDREALGNALTEKEHDEDFALLYDMGVTAVRLAHYPQAEYFYRLCDRYGIVVWAEIPFVDLVGGSGSYEQPDETRKNFFERTKQQLRELICQNYNHPSIVCWGMQNEVHAEFDNVMRPFMEALYQTGKEEDPYRLLTQATNQKTAYNWKSDLLAWNVYPGWYGMSRKHLGRFMDANRCTRPLGISEYGAGGNYTQHEERPKKPRHNGQWHPEEYQTLCHEGFVRQISERPYLWATFVWNMFDFGSDGRNEGAHPGMNDKGLVSFDRKIKKDSYYVYQSSWSIHPMVQIAETRNTQRKKRKITVKVYSNCESVELLVNGSSVGKQKAADCRQKGIFLFKHVCLQKGENLLKAVSACGEKNFVCTAGFTRV